MSTQETECSDCQEKVGLKRKLTGPPRLLLGKFKSREKSDSKRRLRQDKRYDGTPPKNDQQQDNRGRNSELSLITHHSPHKASELEEMESHRDDQQNNLGILVTLEENRGKEENVENKAGVTRNTSKTMKKTLSLLWCRGRKRKESDMRLNIHETKKNTNIDHNSVYDNKSCDTNNEAVAHGKAKRNYFFLMWPISKRSSVTSDVNPGRQCRERGSGVLLQERTTPKVSFKKIYRIFGRKKAHLSVDQLECGASETTHSEAGDQMNQLTGTNEEEHQKQAQEIKDCSPETFTFRAEVSINTNIDSGHIDDEQEIYPNQDAGEIVLSTVSQDKYPVLESRNEILQTSGPLELCCSGDTFDSELPGTLSSKLDLNDADQKEAAKNAVKCRPVITIERAYSSEEENQKVSENETPPFDFLVMNGSWQHLKINSLTNNSIHTSDPSVSPELEQSRCNETLLIQTANSMVHSAICAAVEQFANEQQQNQINLDRV